MIRGYRTVACFRIVTYSKINIWRGLYWCCGIYLLQEGTHLEYTSLKEVSVQGFRSYET